MSISMTPSHHARRLAGVAAVLLAAAGPLACGDATGPKSPVGAYGLSTVNGKPLPASLFADTGFTVDVTAGSLAVQDDGRFVVAVTSRWVVDDNTSAYVTADTGTWTQNGDRIVLTYADSTRHTGTWDGQRVTLADTVGPDVTTLVFAKQ